jgi:hypothetical protein
MCRTRLCFLAGKCEYCYVHSVQEYRLYECVRLSSGTRPHWDDEGVLVIPDGDTVDVDFYYGIGGV